jgi:hypothetical protein
MRIKGTPMNQLLNKCKWVVTFLLLSGCIHQMELSQETMKKVDSAVVGRSFWLKQSLYTGPFYDDDRYALVSTNQFDELAYVKMPDNETILPPNANGIIPYGTKVVVQSIDWPDLQNYLNRPIFTPRHLPWMKLKIALDRGQVSLFRPETFIYVLSIDADNAKHFETWFRTIFSDKDSNVWLLSLKPEFKSGVLEKKAIKGMPRDVLLAALGEPSSWSKEFVDEAANVTKEIASYKKQVVVIEGGVVTKIQALTPSTPEQL